MSPFTFLYTLHHGGSCHLPSCRVREILTQLIFVSFPFFPPPFLDYHFQKSLILSGKEDILLTSVCCKINSARGVFPKKGAVGCN